VTVAAGGKGTLVLILTAKARKAIKAFHGKRFKATLKVTISTSAGTLVTQTSRTLIVRPKPKPKHGHKH
jgi:hypothetical protein